AGGGVGGVRCWAGVGGVDEAGGGGPRGFGSSGLRHKACDPSIPVAPLPVRSSGASGISEPILREDPCASLASTRCGGGYAAARPSAPRAHDRSDRESKNRVRRDGD